MGKQRPGKSSKNMRWKVHAWLAVQHGVIGVEIAFAYEPSRYKTLSDVDKSFLKRTEDLKAKLDVLVSKPSDAMIESPF